MSLLAQVRGLRAELVGFDTAGWSAGDCAIVAEELWGLAKACTAAAVLAANRAVDGGANRERGFNDGAAWMARHSGSTGGQARRQMRTAKSLPKCPGTKEALLAGEISMAQAGEIAEVEHDAQGATTVLLPVAKAGDLSELRERARAHRAAVLGAKKMRQRQWDSRFFRHWLDRNSMVHFEGALPQELGLPLVRHIETVAVRIRKQATTAGRAPASFETDTADALVAIFRGAAPSGAGRAGTTPDPRPAGPPPDSAASPSDEDDDGGPFSDTGIALSVGDNPGPDPPPLNLRPPNSEIIFVVDLRAFRRGHAHPGEVCHIIGGADIPVETVSETFEADPFLKVAFHNGVKIDTICHHGRHIKAELKTALMLGAVPELRGQKCVDCGSRFNLQYDHVDPYAHQGPTSYDNIQPRCWTDHQAKTERDRQAGLLGPRAFKPKTKP